MGTLASTFEKVAWSAGNAISDFASAASSVFESIVGGYTATVQGLYAGDVVGINVNGISDMQAAITSYITDIQSCLDDFAKNTEVTEAFKGTQLEETVQDFIKAIRDCCNSLIGDLESFNDQLSKVAEQYDTNINTTIAQQITQQADELRSAYSGNSGSSNSTKM